ncbi:MAG: DUF3108 domain-containing protein [Terriglobales bacterium]
MAFGQQPTPVFEIHPPPPAFTFPKGVTFVYQGEWRLWNAGTASISLDDAGAGVERVSSVADSSGFVNVLYPVHDRFQSVFDRRTGCSQSVNKHTEEGFHKRETLINFNYSRKKSILDETNLKTNEVKHDEHDIPACVTDVLSGIFYVASQRLQQGDVYQFPLNDGGDTIDVRAQVEGREKVKTPAGTYNTIRVFNQAASGKLQKRGQLWIWYSDDSAHTPVQMRARLFWGTITFALLRTETK